MPDLWIDVDTAVIVPVNILPLIDDTDFKSIETAIVYNSAGMSLVWNFVTTAGVVTGTAVTPTTGGVYDWSEPIADKGMYAIEIPASGGASINNDTEGFGWFTGVATGVLPWRGPTIGFRKASMNNVMVDNGALQDNLEDMFDGTGYAGGTARQKVDVDTIKTQAVTCGAGVTVLASVGTAATNTAQTGDSYARIGANGVSLSAIPWNASWDAEVQSECDDALVAKNLDHLCAVATAAADMTTEVVDNSIISRILANGDTSVFDPSTDGLQPIRDTAPLGTAMRGTDNAALASVCTEARLSELDAGTGGKMANVVDVIAGDVANIDGAAMRGTDSAALAAVCTEDRLARLDVAISTRLAPDGTLATVTNLTNAPGAGDLTATMKASVTTACTAATPTVAAVTGDVGGDLTGTIGGLAAQAKADVNAEVLDVLNVDTFAEPGQEAPAATNTLVKKIGYLYKAWRNKNERTATQYSLYNDDAATVDQKATLSDDSTTFTKAEIASGP